ncbi:IS110 family transposase [Aquabacterium sp. A7-Y]|uniref:IS110 family transposase n=1 Tax=Aquabacterium sp. A7-Y TaxID=1349605 RepID=UPI00223E272B|nr:IS110 family transposase [Aquabacterium sp. A7-Y]MCW7542079.1 IS110 family transposase [Aquabacterium sp. A7-Y]
MDGVIRFWLGIDVSKAKLDVALLDERGKFKQRVFANEPSGFAQMQHWLSERGVAAHQSRVCMEATGPYSEACATALADAGWVVAVVNPARVKGFAQGEMQRNKTDRSDASLLARFCLKHEPEAWQPVPPELRQLRALVDRLQTIKDMQGQELNRLEAQAGNPTLTSSIREHIDWLQRCADALQREIDDHIDGHPRLREDAKLIASIPGIGRVTMPKVMAFLGDVRRFKNAKALAAFIGVTPRLRESGSSVRGRSMISRAGHAQMRRALYMPALVASRHNPAVKAFGDRLRATGMAPKAVIGACMHKLAILIYGVLRSGQPFNLQIAMPKPDFQDGI